MIHESLAVLRRAAEAGTVTITASGPASADAVRRRETGLKPHFGTINWAAPPGYRALLAEHNAFTCRGEFGHDIVIVGDEDMVALNANIVHMPEHTDTGGDGRRLSTNHLVGFADSGAEAVWCFDVTQPDADGEYPVYLREQGEERARYVESGDWEVPADSAPDFARSHWHWQPARSRGSSGLSSVRRPLECAM
ncbi:SMI1/KNR4 family protein [Streptomyces sp. CA-210063]|uniref:SMI1/KNR4 family protein n=1 Tax=Streptomyces sp. CA-210063 TaxID=2801029 RepID=UPI00214AC1E4|nr:SMI1/KNR4 family protein [Streptomyces sp. CA-210063]UUU29143.1 SMI1/KNR4 family protein [Streptomyces sp. CA-210063]